MKETDNFIEQYRSSNRRKIFFIISFILICCVFFIITLGFGTYNISIIDSISAFFTRLMGGEIGNNEEEYIWNTRVPRALGSIAVGAGLAVAGAVMQNDFKNPLAEPYTMGISSGAFLGATLSIVMGISIIPFVTGTYVTMVNAFIFSLIPVGVIILLSKFRKMTPMMMILTGIAIMFFFSSISQIIMVLAPSESMADAYGWRVGSVGRLRWDVIPFVLISTVIFSILIYIFAEKMNVMYVGDRCTKTLGENPVNIRVVTLILASLLTAGIVSFTGTIGFIGLVGPHVARIFVGSNNRYFIPASAAFGATFILIADTIAKISGPNGLPVGVISSMIGGPLFIWILIKQRKSAWT